MINELQMKNFKGVKEGSIKLYPITILIGSNNSAKSTILEALFLSTNPFRKVPYFVEHITGIYPSTAIEAVYVLHKTLNYQGYAFLLHNYTAKNARLTFNFKKSENNQLSNQQWISMETYQQAIYFTSSVDKLNLKSLVGRLSPLGTAEESPSQRYFAYASGNSTGYETNLSEPITEETLLISPKLVLAGYEYLKREWPMIVNSGISRRVAEDVSKLSPEHYKDFTMEPTIGGQVDIHAYLEDGRRIRLGDVGEGIQSYMLSRMLFELVNPEILLWDDIESHLNPRILTILAEWFSDLVKKGKQVIISTHSIEAARVIAGINEEETRVCLCSLINSKLETKLLSLDQLEELEKAGIDARTAEALLL